VRFSASFTEEATITSIEFRPCDTPPRQCTSTYLSKNKLEIDLLEFQCLKHPPYSLDLAPMDFAVFPTSNPSYGE
jgi:hypothetical protein